MEEGSQYRATRLWNDVIEAFRRGVQTGRHRRHMRTYDNCFTGADAANWLHIYLKESPNFADDVSRQQAVQLLQKFLECSVIEDARGLRGNSKKIFQDSKHLYRFLYRSPVKPVKKSPFQVLKRTPLSLRNKDDQVKNIKNGVADSKLLPIPSLDLDENTEPQANNAFPVTKASSPEQMLSECCLISRNPSMEEIEAIWKSVIMSRMRLLLGGSRLDEILKNDDMSGRTVMHNMYKISKNGIVVLLDKSDDLPKWVVNAMKCLINWPNASGSGSCLPNYPGFEMDVFTVVKDFFGNLGSPLIPAQIYELFQAIIGLTNESLDDDSGSSTISPVYSTENLRVLDSKPDLEDFKMPDLRKGKGSEYRYETAFTNSSPFTRIVCQKSHLSCHGSRSSMLTQDSQTGVAIETASTISACSSTFNETMPPTFREIKKASLLKSPCSQSADELCALSDGDKHHQLKVNSTAHVRCSSVDNMDKEVAFGYTCAITTLPKRAYIRTTSTLADNRGFPTLRRIKREKEQKKEQSQSNMSSRSQSGGYINLGFAQNMVVNDRESTASSTTDSVSFHTTHSNPSLGTLLSSQSIAASGSSNTFKSVGENFSSVSCLSYRHRFSSSESLPARIGEENEKCTLPKSPSIVTLPDARALRRDDLKRKTIATCMMARSKDKTKTPESLHEEIIKGFQLVSLLLAPYSRRYLHLLLRFIYKAARNEHLVLDSVKSNLQVLVEAFAQPLISSYHNLNVPVEQSQQFLQFMVEFCDIIFKPPSDLRLEVEARIAILRRGRIKFSVDDVCSIAYCEQVSVKQFEEQKRTFSEQALLDLLDSILNDPNILEKEREKRLHQFKETYPKLYSLRQGSTKELPFKRQTKSRSTLINKLKNVRF